MKRTLLMLVMAITVGGAARPAAALPLDIPHLTFPASGGCAGSPACKP